MKQTAMQELIEQLEVNKNMFNKKSRVDLEIRRTYQNVILMIEQGFLDKEKQQTCWFTRKCHNHYRVYGDFNVEDYYNQTFKD